MGTAAMLLRPPAEAGQAEDRASTSHAGAAPSRWALRHEDALDGLRGLAVAAVVAYHLGLRWARGGFLGVSLFFTLSGFLIANLLINERQGSGSIGLRAFWARRARRLLPAACAGIALAVVVAAVNADSHQVAQLRGDVIGAVAYVANWRFVLNHSTYQAGYQAPSPLLHYWSLAIEEQLYLVLPLLVLAATWRFRTRRALGAVVVLGMVVSAVVTFALGSGPNRVYFGTDTRMFELLAGVLLAVVIGFPAASDTRRRPRGVATLATASLLATLAIWVVVAEGDRWVYRGGLWLVAALSCGLIVAAVRTAGPVRLLRWRPLVALGRVSYGVYVYHWPLFMLIDDQRTGLHGVALAAVRLAATAVLAAASYRWLEQPIRQRRWTARRLLLVFPAVPVALIAVAVVVSGEAPALAVAAVAEHPIVIPARSAPVAAAPVSISDQPPPPPPPLHRVLFMGDSLMQQAFPTFAARLHDRGVEAKVIGSPGVSLMSGNAALITSLAGAVTSGDPDLVVLESCCGLLGTDAVWRGPGGAPIPRDSPPLYEEWRRLAAQATTIAVSRGAVVMWVLGPPLQTNGWYGAIDGQVAKVNAIYQSLVTCTGGTGVVDWQVVGGPDGRFVRSLPDTTGQLVTIRTPDGFHFTPAGWDTLAGITLDAIDRQWASDGGRPSAVPSSCDGGRGHHAAQ